jgi:hypothetical protein
VINALVDRKATHIPYRESSLTRLLQNSLGGNAKTIMCANCGPADFNTDETLSTLRFARRVKAVKNKPKINEDPKDTMLKQYQDEIKALREQLQSMQSTGGNHHASDKLNENAEKEFKSKEAGHPQTVVVESTVNKEEIEKELNEQFLVEKEKIQKEFQSSMNSLLHQQTLTEKEKQALLKDLQKEKEIRLQYEESQFALKEKMNLLQNQIISGNQSLLTKAQKQEIELKALNIKLKEQQEQEIKLKQSLVEKEREKDMLEFEKLNEMEDHYLSLQDELTMKTNKLKKLYKSYQTLVRERNELQEELQEERRQAADVQSEQFSILQLKELIIHHFIPEDYSQAIEAKAVRVPEENDSNNHEMKWIIPHENITGTSLRCSVDRPISNQSLRRPETEFARQQRNNSNSSNNPRYSMENVLILEFDRHGEKLTEQFVTDSKNMKNTKKMNKSKVDSYLTMNIYDDNDDHSGEVFFEEGKKNFQ